MARELPNHRGLPARTNREVDWSKFDNGKTWELVQGTDFDQTPKGAAHAARQWGYYNNRRLSISVKDDRIVLRIHPG